MKPTLNPLSLCVVNCLTILQLMNIVYIYIYICIYIRVNCLSQMISTPKQHFIGCINLCLPLYPQDIYDSPLVIVCPDFPMIFPSFLPTCFLVFPMIFHMFSWFSHDFPIILTPSPNLFPPPNFSSTPQQTLPAPPNQQPPAPPASGKPSVEFASNCTHIHILSTLW